MDNGSAAELAGSIQTVTIGGFGTFPFAMLGFMIRGLRNFP
jgi:hypothetical protein